MGGVPIRPIDRIRVMDDDPRGNVSKSVRRTAGVLPDPGECHGIGRDDQSAASSVPAGVDGCHDRPRCAGARGRCTRSPRPTASSADADHRDLHHQAPNHDRLLERDRAVRNAAGPPGRLTRPAVALGRGEPLNVPIAGLAGVPSTAVAAVINLTIDGPDGRRLRHRLALRRGLRHVDASTSAGSQTIANLAARRAGHGGAICITASVEAHVIVDISGYVAKGGQLFSPLGPSPHPRHPPGAWRSNRTCRRRCSIAGATASRRPG